MDTLNQTEAEDGLPVPTVPASAGAMIFDRKSRLLILKPTYKSGWTIPGGEMEADGESPWEACRREVREECGLDVRTGVLACVDFRRPRPGRPGGVRFLFDCGTLDDAVLATVTVQPEEISEHRLAPLATALELLRGPVRRRVARAARARTPLYLEEGRPVVGVEPARPASGGDQHRRHLGLPGKGGSRRGAGGAAIRSSDG